MKKISALLPLLFVVSASLATAPIEIVPPDFRGAVQPQVAQAPGGRVHVVFGRDNAIYHTASLDGRVFSTPVKVGELDKLALRMRRGPRISATDKLIVVTATSHAEGNLHSWTSADGGATWKEGPHVNDADQSAKEGLHAMAGSGSGLVIATWLDHRNPGAELWSAASHDGGLTWSANTRVYQSPDGSICQCCHPSVAVDLQGRVAVMWRNWLHGSRDLYLTTSADGGKSFAPAEKLGAGTWKLNACPMDGGAIALDPAGKPIEVWRREKTVFLSETPANERKLDDSAAQPVIASGKGGTYLLWEHAGGLMLQHGASAPVRFAEKAQAASIAATPDAHPFVVWESGATLMGERLE